MPSDHDRLFPPWNQSGDVFNDNWFSEDCATQNVSDCSIGAFPHLFEFELFDSCLIGCDSGAFDPDFTVFNGLSSINGNLIIGLISMLDSEVKILDVEVQKREDKFVFDRLPNDSGHLVSIELDNRV